MFNQENMIYSRINIRDIQLSKRKQMSHLSGRLVRINAKTKEMFTWPGRRLLVKANCFYAWLRVM